MNALATIQASMQRWLLHGGPGVGAFVEGDDSAHRLRIYADAYRLRLIEILGNDFPVTRSVLGDDAFDALAGDYLRAHPSAQPSVRHFGRAYADWLQGQREVPPALHEISRFEWMQGECFDAAEVPVLGIGHVAALSAGEWPTLRLELQPCVRLLVMACNAPELAVAHASAAASPELRDDVPSHWLLWRSEYDVQWRRLDDDEALALRAIAAGETFAQLCERMNELHGDDGALRVASLLKRWLADGLLAADPESTH